ncbi:MAG: c-type cytochrome, partial [Mariniblastus sp.]
ELFRLGLESRDVLTVKNSAIGLRRISQPVGVSAILAASNALIRMSWDKSTVSARDQLVMFLENETQQKFGYKFKSIGGIQVDVLDRISRWIEREYPEEFLVNQQQQKSVGRRLSERIAAVDWSRGNAERGASLYKNLQCARCHDAGSRLGPRLEGLGKRFSRDDLFRAIIYPNEQVPERYRAVAIETVDGQYIQGAMVYESVDGITLQQTDGKTRRINRDQIEFQMRSDKSLMPEGLLDYATDGDLADLYEYLSK